MTETNGARAHRITESHAPVAPPRNARSGQAASAAGREFLLREFGDEHSLDEAMRKPGRPPRTSTNAAGASPTVRGRVPRGDYDQLSRIESATGKTESELVREGIALVIARYASRRESA